MPADPPGDQASNSALQRLGQAMRDLHAAAGRPSLRMVSQRVKEGGHPGTASHTTVGTILKGTKPVSWEALAAVVTELVRIRELEAAPTEDEDPRADGTARLQAEMQACTRVRTLWLEVECHKDDGASESTKAARSLAWELHRLIVEPLGGDLARISRAIRALRVEDAPRLTDLADSLHGIVQGSRHPQPRDIDLLLELREHEGLPVLPDDREALERSYVEWLRCTSPAMYDLLVHHQNELKAAHSRAERWEGESRRLSAEKTRSEHGKAAEIQVFQARASADQSRLVARLKTVEAQNAELRQQLERAEQKAAQLERARDALAAKAALQDTRDTVERAAEGFSAPYTSAAAVPPWDTMVPSAYVADFTSLYGAEPQRSSADASYDPYTGHASYAYGADQAWTRYGQWPSADSYDPAYKKPATAPNRSLNPAIPRQRRRVFVEPFLPLWIPQQTATTTGSWTPTAVSMQASCAQATTTTAGTWSMSVPQPDEHSGFRRLLRPVAKLFRRGKGRHARRER